MITRPTLLRHSTQRLDNLLNIDNPYFEGMVNQIYPPELQLNKDDTSDTEAPFLDLHLSISNGFVSTKIYDKRDDFDFDIVNFPFLDGDAPRRPSYGVYISQLIRYARVCSHVDDFNTRNKCLTAKLLKQGYHYHKLKKAFSKFYRRHYNLRAFGVLQMVPLEIIANQRALNIFRQLMVPFVETLVPRPNGTIGKPNGQQFYNDQYI